MMIKSPEASALEAMRQSKNVPAGGRSVEKAADTMAGGVQATRKKIPQLLPDGLSPAMHLQAAMCDQNPLTYIASTTVAVKYALANAPNDFNETNERRKAVAATIRLLAAACDEEMNE